MKTRGKILNAIAAGLVCVSVRGVQAQDSLRLVLNIPAYRLEVWKGSARTHSFNVAIGTAKFPTPTGSFEVTEVTWNPWWLPPESDWARKEKPQPPGPENPLGVVRMRFAPLYALHGTNAAWTIGQARSHGCVRLQNAEAVALARIIGGGDPVTTTLQVKLQRPVSLEIDYNLAEFRSDTLWTHPDVYGRRTKAYTALALAALYPAVDTTLIDPAALAQALRRAERRHLAIPLAQLKQTRR